MLRERTRPIDRSVKAKNRKNRLPTLNVGTPVPLPEATSPTSGERRRRWPWFLGALLVVVVGLAAIRGDAPATVVVTDGAVVPLEPAEPVTRPSPTTYTAIDPTGGDYLEVCDWDYCVVQDLIGEGGIDPFLYEISLAEARAIAGEVTKAWDVPSVPVTSEPIPGELAGYYDPQVVAITLDEPIIAWALLHELAHHIVRHTHGTDALSHGLEFLETLEALSG